MVQLLSSRILYTRLIGFYRLLKVIFILFFRIHSMIILWIQFDFCSSKATIWKSVTYSKHGVLWNLGNYFLIPKYWKGKSCSAIYFQSFQYIWGENESTYIFRYLRGIWSKTYINSNDSTYKGARSIFKNIKLEAIVRPF